MQALDIQESAFWKLTSTEVASLSISEDFWVRESLLELSWSQAPLCCEDTYGSPWVMREQFWVCVAARRVYVCGCLWMCAERVWDATHSRVRLAEPQTLRCHLLLRRHHRGDIHVPGNYQDYDVGTLMMYEGPVRGESHGFTESHY